MHPLTPSPTPSPESGPTTLELLAARGLVLPLGPTTAASLRAEGWTPRDLAVAARAGLLSVVKRGIYAPAEQLTPEEGHARLVRVVAEASPERVVSHVSAAVMHGLPVRREALERVHLSGAGKARGKTSTNIIFHRSPVADHECEERHGVRVTSLERTIADLGRREPFAWGVAAADAALRRNVARAALADYVEAGRRRPGNQTLRAVVAFADAGAASALESLSRVSMQRAGLPKPVLQFEVHNADGEWVATCDFGWPDHLLVGEADGRTKYEEGAKRGKNPTDVVMVEKARDQAIRLCDLWVAHWGYDEATSPDALLRLLGRRLGVR